MIAGWAFAAAAKQLQQIGNTVLSGVPAACLCLPEIQLHHQYPPDSWLIELAV